MIPRSFKFPMRTKFVAFKQSASQLTSSHLRLFYAAAPSSRLSVVIPAKVSKLATTRAFLRRLVYTQFWPKIATKNFECVVLFKPLPLPKPNISRPIIVSELQEFHV